MFSLPLTVLASVLLIACGASSARDIAEPRHIAASSGAPEVERVVDLGDLAAIPASGALSTEASDGVFVIGELVLIEGDDFGKLPTISIDGKPAKSLARTKSGGILVRIPPETSSGRVRVEVSHREGRHGIDVQVRRYLALGDGSHVHLVSANNEGNLDKQEVLAIPDMVDLEMGHDGQALYVLAASSLSVVALARQGGPDVRARMSLEVTSPRALVARIGVPVLALLHAGGVTTFDTRVPTAISESGRIALEGGARAAALSPNGDYLAVLSGQGNSLSLVALADKSVLTRLELMVGDTVSLVQGVVFSPAGDEIWVLSGNSSGSMAAGVRPTQLSIIKLEAGTLSLSGSATIALASAPLFMAVSQREAIMAAAAVRSTSQRATMVLSSVPSDLLLDTSNTDHMQGQLLRFDLEGKASIVAEGNAIFSETRLSHTQKQVFAATRNLEGASRSLGVTSIGLDGAETSYLRLADDSEPNLLAPLSLAIAP